MSSEELIYTKRGHVAWLRMNRPEAMNAINLAMIAGFERVLPGQHLRRCSRNDNRLCGRICCDAEWLAQNLSVSKVAANHAASIPF